MATAVTDPPTATAKPAFTGEFTWVDPYTLVVDPFNHRHHHDNEEDTTEPDAELIASVEETGVQSPILLRPQPSGAPGNEVLGIIYGQRRHKAALIAADKAKAEGRPYFLLPALVRRDLTNVDDEALALSVLENKQRTDPHIRDYIEAARQLSLMDAPPAAKERHARITGLTRDEMKAAETATKLSPESLADAIAADFDLLELADYQEVEQVPGARTRLRQAKREDQSDGNGRRGHWAQALSKLRQHKEEMAKRVALIADLVSADITMVDWHPTWRDTKLHPLEDLLDQHRKKITPTTHAECPGHAASIDPSEPEVTWLCADWAKHGHTLTKAAARDTPTQQAEEERAKRREVIANNKAWRAARQVRHDFITNLCDAPGDAPDAIWKFTLSTILGTLDTYSSHISRHRTDLMAQFLKIADPNEGQAWYSRVDAPFGTLISRTGKTRRWRPLFAQVAAAYEHEAMSDRAWRDDIRINTVTWLAFLKERGYVLSDLEGEVLVNGLKQHKGRTPRPRHS
ncbi:ParB/RepB/Spo0J family partition protein [Streptomyces sp. NPDC048696]|uniref:ParB/RepB/Spo0J family partition protein n=1 Tax=Streptomyces sp. NPDC048696 TaxID=3365585 RepID=UPI0037238641